MAPSSSIRASNAINPERRQRAAAVAARGGYEPLTDREHQVLRLLSRGMTSREIAQELHLAPNTVRSYTQEVLAKLGSSNRVQAVGTARRLHLI